MNITELDKYNLADAVKFHDRLNPRLWGRDEHLLPEVTQKLLAIAADFQEFLGVPDLDVEDITISGSNAAYNYTPESDIDLHLVVRMPADNSEVFQELFNAKKYQYNDEHDIRIGGADVELYVQPQDQPHHSQGIYSVRDGEWRQVPRRKKVDINDTCVIHKTEDLQSRIDAAIASGNEDAMSRLWDKIKTMRQTGLEQQGEFGCDNLVFKMLRRSGHIEQLKTAKTQAHDRALSLSERKKKKKKSVRYGFGGYWYPGFNFSGDSGSEGGGDGGGGESVREGHQGQPYSSEDGVAPSTQMFLNETDHDEKLVHEFIKSTAEQLGIERMPEIVLHRDDDWGVTNHSFGKYEPDSHTLHVNLAGRHIMDVLRTTAHELAHCRQHEISPLPDSAGDTGSPWENQAHATAGVIMRHWADQHPELFDSDVIEEATGYIPKNKREARDPRFSMAITQDIKPGQVGREANKLALHTGRNGEPGLLMKTANLREGRVRDLNDPPGPEFPPTMPAGTVRVDVSDMYDWYKLGQHISNMKGLGKHDFGAGPPSTIFSFGDEDLEHQYIDALKRTGLTTTDIDPVDPKQPPGMPRQKVDPTYNVSEGANDYLWHGSKSEHKILYPQQANDTGGKEESNKNAVYATPSAKTAIAMGLTTPGSDTGMFPNDPQMVLFSGNIRKGQMVYLHKVPKDLFIKHNSREWYSKPGVKAVKPIEVVKVPVDQWLHLIRPATPQDWELRKKYTKEDVTEAFDQPYPLTWERGDHGDWSASAQMPDGKYIEILFTRWDKNKDEWDVEFYRNLSQEVTGEGDAMRVFATVMQAVRKFANKIRPGTVKLAATKDVEPGVKPESRARLYQRMAQRFAADMGYQMQTQDRGHQVNFVFTRQTPVTEQGLSWSSLDPGLTMEDKMSIFEQYHVKGSLKESVDQDKKEYFQSLFDLSDPAEKNKKYIVVPTLLVSNKVMLLDQPGYMTFLGLNRGGMVFDSSDGQRTYPSKTMRDLSIFNTFTFSTVDSYNKFRTALSLKFDIDLPNIQDSQDIAEDNLVESLRREFEILESQYISEISMRPASLRQEAAKTGAIAGMEFEMIVPNANVDDDYADSEPDWDMDESVNDIDDACNFFHDGDYNSRRAIADLRSEMTSQYEEWYDERKKEAWDEEGSDYIRDWLWRTYEDDWRAEAEREVLDDTPEFGTNSEELQQRIEDFVTEKWEAATEDVLANMGPDWDAAYEEWDEDWRGNNDLEQEWLRDQGWDTMKDIYDNFDISWPYHYTPESSGTDINAVAEDFSDAVGMPVNASSSYHGGRREPGHYVVEPDGSLEPDDSDDGGLEFVSPPMPIDELLDQLKKVKEWAGRYGCYTNSSTGLHINISVPNYDLAKLDYVKLALLMGDEYVLDQFGRSSNTYAKSAMVKIKNILRDYPDKAQAVLDKMKGHMDDLATKAIHSGTTDKYTSINTKSGYIEFRSPGGDWLDENFDKVENTLLRFTVALSAAMDPAAYREEYLKKLYKLLSPKGEEDPISYFAKYSAGQLPKSALRSFVKQVQLQRRIKRGETGGEKYWWNVQWDANRRMEVVATSKENALYAAAQEWGVPESHLAGAKITPIRPYDQSPVRAQVGEPQAIGRGSGATLNGRPSNPDGNYVITPEDDRRSVYYRFAAAGFDDANTVRRQWAQQHPDRVWVVQRDDNTTLGQPPIPGSTLDLQRQRAAATMTTHHAATDQHPAFTMTRPVEPTADQQQGGLVDVANEPPRPLGAGRELVGWSVLDADTGQELTQYRGIGNNQADANRIAANWARQQGIRRSVEVVPLWREA